MNIKHLFLISLMSVCLVACNNFSNKKAYDDYSRFTNGESETVEEQKKPERSNAFYERLLESFCNQYYSSSFDGRSFVSNSINIKDRWGNEEKTSVSGTHSYKGRFGKIYNNANFVASIVEEEEGYFKIDFIKESAPDLFHDQAYKEASGVRTIHYSE